MKTKIFVILQIAMFAMACNKPDYFYTTYVDGSIGDMHTLKELQFDRALAIFVY